MPDLLPDDFGTETVQPPVLILREQAEHLGRRTGGLVLARVDTMPNRGGEEFLHAFVLEVPTLDNYAFSLFLVTHSLFLYPLEIDTQLQNIPPFNRIENQTQFEEALRSLFAHLEVRKVIAALKAQAAATIGANTRS